MKSAFAKKFKGKTVTLTWVEGRTWLMFIGWRPYRAGTLRALLREILGVRVKPRANKRRRRKGN